MVLAFLLVAILAAAKDDAPVKFSIPRDRVYAVAMLVVAKSAVRIEQANQESGFISYVAWYSKLLGVKFPVSITLISEDDGKATQLLVVCEKSEVKKKTVRAISEELLRQGLIQESEAQRVR